MPLRLAGKRWENELHSVLRQAHCGGREARTWIALFRDQDGQSKDQSQNLLPELFLREPPTQPAPGTCFPK